MANNVDISIIIPVYNGEKWISACIDSILNQNRPTYEIILIDDGSTDSSGLICEKYESKYNNIHVRHKTNGGVSSARNIGLRNAIGKYVCFVDCDDYLPPKGLQVLYDAIEREKAEYCAYVSKKDNIRNCLDLSNDHSELMKYLTTGYSYYPWGKLFLLKTIIDNEVFFAEDMDCSEDTLFIRDYLSYCKRICFVREKVYCYNTESNGISHKFHEYYAEYYIRKLASLDRLLTTCGFSKDEKDVFLSERAIHGLKVTIEHMASCENRNSFIELKVMNAIVLFNTWIHTNKTNDIRLIIWYRLNRGNIQKRNVTGLLRNTNLCIRIRKVVKAIFNVGHIYE